jgi:NarL family two-component system response regulator YdfI
VIRTLVAAESERARAEVGASLRGDDRLEVVGETPLLARARSVAALDPDVLVEVRDRPGGPARVPTVVLTGEPHLVWTAEAFGGGGGRAGFAVLGSSASPDELVAAVVAVAAGLVATQPATLARGPGVSADVLENERLSPREVDVLGELARGAPNKQIAGRLGISEHTVKFHIASIFAKLGVSSRTEAVTRGVRLGLIML